MTHKKNKKNTIALVCFLCASCSTIFNRTQNVLAVDVQGEEACQISVYNNNWHYREINRTGLVLETSLPARLEIDFSQPRWDSDVIVLHLNCPNRDTATMSIKRSPHWSFFLNILSPMAIGGLIDYWTGSMWTYKQRAIVFVRKKNGKVYFEQIYK